MMSSTDEDSSSQVFLVIDQQIHCEVTNQGDCVLALLSSYHVFNICYPKGCNNFFVFLKLNY